VDSKLPPSTSPLAGKRVIVAGAGIAGLAFVIALRNRWNDSLGAFPTIIQYEREDGKLDLSREGYSVSIRRGGEAPGVQALRQMNIFDDVLNISVRRNEQEHGYIGLWTLDWHMMLKTRDKHHEGGSIPGIRVARARLRRLLQKVVMEHGQIEWGVACTGASTEPDGRIRVRTSDGREEVCDLLIGADGAWSRLRTCIRPADKLNFAGAVSISAVSRFSEPLPEAVRHNWGIIPGGEGTALFAAPLDERSANWSLSYIAETPRMEYRQPLPAELNAQLLQEARTRGPMFKQPFQTLMEHSDVATLMVFNAMDKKGFPHGPANGVPDGIVFIGDSNHAVSPFAGDGANLALNDGYDLANCLCTYRSVPEAVQAYDKRALKRASSSLGFSHELIAIAHSRGWRWNLYQTAFSLLGMVLPLWYKCKDLLYSKNRS
jgi:2-polyprenyl-6-methoxyphenol hydroxylase-like FAD-dependent oxidoreductase